MTATTDDQQTAVEYHAQTSSTAISGEATLRITEEGLLITTVLDAIEIPFCDIDAIDLTDYVVSVVTETDRFSFAKMGQWAEPFFGELHKAYNAKVRTALFTSGEAKLVGAGGYTYTEEGQTVTGVAPVEVYENCVIILPPDISARRIPLHFLTGLEMGDFTLTHRVGEDFYTLSKLGRETDLFDAIVQAQAKAMREKTLGMVSGIDPSLGAEQAAQLAKLMPGGSAASLATLTEIAPSFVAVAEEAIGKSRSAEYYAVLKDAAAPDSLYLGFLPSESMLRQEEQVVEDIEAEAPDESQPSTLFYVVAFSPDTTKVAVEFAVPGKESAATFIYRVEGDADAFVNRLNRAMEAVDYKRDVISMPDEQLHLPENRRYAMAVKRSPALARIRTAFADRLIHSSVDAWKKNLATYF